MLAAFGAAGEPQPLDGVAWRAGEIVLKPLDMGEAALRWQAAVLRDLAVRELRVAAPLRARDDELVVDGWTAWPFLPGAHAPRWAEIVAAGERLHRALAGVPRPEFLDARDDPWARADRVAWEELPAAGPVAPEVERLLDARRPVTATSQLVHGDLSGNVLFAAGMPPAVIDLSPYWRPPAYAAAIVAVDAVLWHGAELDLLDGANPQLLVRALLFRLLAAREPTALLGAARPAIERVL